MDAETRRTLAATILSAPVRVSFVFLALRGRNRENGASAQKTNGKTREREREGGGVGREREAGEEQGEKNQIVSHFRARAPCIKKKTPRIIRKSDCNSLSFGYRATRNIRTTQYTWQCALKIPAAPKHTAIDTHVHN